MISSQGLALLRADLSRVPEATRGGLRKAVRAAGQSTLDEARANASWSSRIPGALTMRVSLAGNNPGVVVLARASVAPHARPYEGIISDPFQHPVYGNRNAWVPQAARPFLFPAAEANAEPFRQGVRDAVDAALRANNL